jgi:hypothetical protein
MLQLAVRNRRESKRIFFSFYPERLPKLSKLDSSLEFDMRRNHGAHVASRTVVIGRVTST